MSYSIVKSVTAGVAVGVIDKVAFGGEWKGALKYGALETGIVFVTDNIIGATILSSLNIVAYYAQDVLSSLLFAVATMLLSKQKLVHTHGFIKDFLVALGGAWIGTYAESPIRAMLNPNGA